MLQAATAKALRAAAGASSRRTATSWTSRSPQRHTAAPSSAAATARSHRAVSDPLCCASPSGHLRPIARTMHSAGVALHAAQSKPDNGDEAFTAVQHFGRNGRVRHFSLPPVNVERGESANAAAACGPATAASSASSASSRRSAAQAASFLVVHRGDEDRRDAAAQLEKQQLLHALFSTGTVPDSAGGAAAAATPATDNANAAAAVVPTPFSPRWYPLASLLSHLLPQHYPHSVTAYYISYSKWSATLRLCTASTRFSTQKSADALSPVALCSLSCCVCPVSGCSLVLFSARPAVY